MEWFLYSPVLEWQCSATRPIAERWSVSMVSLAGKVSASKVDHHPQQPHGLRPTPIFQRTDKMRIALDLRLITHTKLAEGTKVKAYTSTCRSNTTLLYTYKHLELGSFRLNYARSAYQPSYSTLTVAIVHSKRREIAPTVQHKGKTKLRATHTTACVLAAAQSQSPEFRNGICEFRKLWVTCNNSD